MYLELMGVSDMHGCIGSGKNQAVEQYQAFENEICEAVYLVRFNHFERLIS